MNDKSLFIVLEFLCKLEAIVVDAPMGLQQLEDRIFIQIIFLYLNECKELFLHFIHPVIQESIFSE